MDACLLLSLAALTVIEVLLYTVQQRASFVLIELQPIEFKSYLIATPTYIMITSVIVIV